VVLVVEVVEVKEVIVRVIKKSLEMEYQDKDMLVEMVEMELITEPLEEEVQVRWDTIIVMELVEMEL
jgi:hypothetical protein